MVFIFKKQAIYNCIFAVGLFLSCLSAFAVVFNSDVSEPTSATLLSGKIIVIDAGHGSPDSGAIGYSGTYEKDLNLSVAKKTGDLLQKCGAHVIYTRESDETIADNNDDSIRNIKRNDMSKRISIRDSSDADIFISIHMNNFTVQKYSGAQVFYNNDYDSQKLADCIQTSFKNNLDSNNTRDIKDASNGIFVLNGCKIPAVLVECGFISNPDEEKKLISNEYQNKIAFAICSGIINFLTNT